jgi:hypothetical protein
LEERVMAVSAKIFVEERPDARQYVRQATDDPGTLWTPAGAAVEGTVENVSEMGCLVRMPALLPVGTIVRIAGAGLETREARIVRRDGAAFGCEFLLPKPPSPALERGMAAKPARPVSYGRPSGRISTFVASVFAPWLVVAWVALLPVEWDR